VENKESFSGFSKLKNKTNQNKKSTCLCVYFSTTFGFDSKKNVPFSDCGTLLEKSLFSLEKQNVASS